MNSDDFHSWMLYWEPYQCTSIPCIASPFWLQPLHNLNNDNPVRSQPYSEVIAVARRRHSLRPIGMEIFFKADPVSGVSASGASGVAEGASAFFTFRDLKLRDQVASMLLEQLGVNTSSPSGYTLHSIQYMIHSFAVLLNSTFPSILGNLTMSVQSGSNSIPW